MVRLGRHDYKTAQDLSSHRLVHFLACSKGNNSVVTCELPSLRYTLHSLCKLGTKYAANECVFTTMLLV